MPDKINGLGRAGIPPSRSRESTEARNAQRDTSEARTAGASEQVQLTDSARRLRRLEAELATRSEVDEARVAALKERIADGRFDLDPGRIAKRLIKTEREL